MEWQVLRDSIKKKLTQLDCKSWLHFKCKVRPENPHCDISGIKACIDTMHKNDLMPTLSILQTLIDKQGEKSMTNLFVTNRKISWSKTCDGTYGDLRKYWGHFVRDANADDDHNYVRYVSPDGRKVNCLSKNGYKALTKNMVITEIKDGLSRAELRHFDRSIEKASQDDLDYMLRTVSCKFGPCAPVSDEEKCAEFSHRIQNLPARLLERMRIIINQEICSRDENYF